MYSVQQAIENTINELLGWDAIITTKVLIDRLNEYIDNLNSYIGIESHKRLESLGIVDKTGMSWIEQDRQTQEQINDYKATVDYLQSLPTDYDWTDLVTEISNNPWAW